jgi:tetratricopeptide (TPR) repeat protein
MTRTLVWTALLAIAAAAMAATPLLGLLGFESSFVLGLCASLAAAHLAAETVFRARAAASPAYGDLADARPGRAIARLYLAALRRPLAALLLPLAILTANALRVKNCDLAGGFAWFLLLPVGSAATGAAAGLVAGLATRRRLAGTLLAVAIVLGSLLWGVARFYAAPPVFGFDPFAGYFPGSLYDEELPIPGPFLVARALHFTYVFATLAIAAAFCNGRTLRLALRPRAPRVLVLGAALLAGALFARAATQPDCAPDAASIAATLGGRLDTAHLTLFYDPAGPWTRDIALHAQDAELRWAQLAGTFGVRPQGRISAYLFDNSDQKRRLLGASHTQIAKPWRREIYLQHDAFPHPVIKHELAHVFAGEFGDPIFHVARHGLHFSPGLIEGAAVAADAHPERVSLDQQVKILREDHLEPPLDQILGPRFFAWASSQAYSTAGSFCRFLLETRGPERFRVLYASGGDFESAYGEPLPALAAEWGRRIDATPLSDEERSLAHDRLHRPSVFHKVCAHELAVRRDEARALSARGDHAAALARLESVCSDDPDEPAHIAELMDAHLAARDEAAAVAVAQRLLAHPKVSDALRARALTLLGDARLRGGNAGAADYFRRALGLPLDENTARQLRARVIAAEDPVIGPALARYLTGDVAGAHDPALDLLHALEMIDAAPRVGLGHYLAGRQLAAHDRWTEARAAFARARQLGLPDRGFLIESRKMEATAAFRTGDRAGARALFVELAAEPAPPGLAAEARDWIARCDFVAP